MYEARGISKRYGSTTALENVSVRIEPGTVHAILGANGAGKSTLMKILAGAEKPTAGGLYFADEPVSFSTPDDAAQVGISWVSQELSIFPDLDVLENMFLGQEITRLGVSSRARMHKAAAPFLEMVGLANNLEGPLSLRRLGERQRVEIARALMQHPRVLILDEPTSALDATETERLLAIVRELSANGVAIVLVSHFLEDVFAVADVVTVIRDGKMIVDAVPAESMDPSSAVKAMLGERAIQVEHEVSRQRRAAKTRSTHEPSSSDQPHVKASESRLVVQGLTLRGALKPTSFTVQRGEVVALAGLEGAGPNFILDLLYGHRRPDSGTITLPSGRKGPRSIARAVREGLAFVPSDRAHIGLFLDQSVRENVNVVRTLALDAGAAILRRREAEEHAAARIKQLDVRPHRADLPARALSGGNQQKVVFAKWLEAKPDVFLLDDPTRGVDVGTRSDMHALIRRLADEGRIILIASGDLDELATVADRAIIFFHGEAVGTMAGEELNPHALLEAINTGIMNQDPAQQPT